MCIFSATITRLLISARRARALTRARVLSLGRAGMMSRLDESGRVRPSRAEQSHYPLATISATHHYRWQPSLSAQTCCARMRARVVRSPWRLERASSHFSLSLSRSLALSLLLPSQELGRRPAKLAD